MPPKIMTDEVIPLWMYRLPTLSVGNRLALLVGARAGHHGVCTVSYKKMAAILGCSVDALKREKRRMVAKGVLRAATYRGYRGLQVVGEVSDDLLNALNEMTPALHYCRHGEEKN